MPFALSLLPVMTLAMQAAPCPATPAPLAGALAPWRAPVAASTQLTVGRSHDLALRPQGAVTFPVAPGKPGAADRFGGVFAFDVARGGTVRVALDKGAWIDLVRDGAALASTAHGHGPECSGIRKVVDFAVVPGRYTLQIAGNTDASIRVMVTEPT